jgi:DNA invertase Pin-like site-specific DNA recombinase
MIKATIYCRVSTDNQEREGTSLQTQLAARTFCRTRLVECRSRGIPSPLWPLIYSAIAAR